MWEKKDKKQGFFLSLQKEELHMSLVLISGHFHG